MKSEKAVRDLRKIVEGSQEKNNSLEDKNSPLAKKLRSLEEKLRSLAKKNSSLKKRNSLLESAKTCDSTGNLEEGAQRSDSNTKHFFGAGVAKGMSRKFSDIFGLPSQ